MKKYLLALITTFIASSAIAQSTHVPSQISRLPKLSGHYLDFRAAPGFAAVEPSLSLVVRNRSCGRQKLAVQTKVARDVTYVKVVNTSAGDCPGPITTHTYRLHLNPYLRNVVVLNPIDTYVAK